MIQSSAYARSSRASSAPTDFDDDVVLHPEEPEEYIDLPPTAPRQLQLDAISANAALISWAAATDDVGLSRYEIRRDGVIIGTVPMHQFEYEDLSIKPNTYYSYTVRAVDVVGNRSNFSESLVAKTMAASSSSKSSTAPGSTSSQNSSLTTSSQYSQSSYLVSTSSSSVNYSDGASSAQTSSIAGSASSNDQIISSSSAAAVSSQHPQSSSSKASSAAHINSSASLTSSSEQMTSSSAITISSQSSINTASSAANNNSSAALASSSKQTTSSSAESNSSAFSNSSLIATSSSDSSSISAHSSSSSSETNFAKLEWNTPSQREDGSYLELDEIGGYELRYKPINSNVYVSEIIYDRYATSINMTDAAPNSLFQIAAFDTNGLYSRFVQLTPQ